MSTIASPRPSLSLRSPSSSRTSLDIPQPQRAGNPRRNRAALRDYYNIKANEGLQATPAKEELEVSELDKEGFDPEEYVKDVLEKQGLEGVLKVEGGLVNGRLGLLWIKHRLAVEFSNPMLKILLCRYPWSRW